MPRIISGPAIGNPAVEARRAHSAYAWRWITDGGRSVDFPLVAMLSGIPGLNRTRWSATTVSPSWRPAGRSPPGFRLTGKPSSDAFEQRAGAEPPATAHRDEPQCRVGAFELVQRRGHEPRAGGADRVPERNRAAIRIDPFG